MTAATGRDAVPEEAPEFDESTVDAMRRDRAFAIGRRTVEAWRSVSAAVRRRFAPGASIVSPLGWIVLLAGIVLLTIGLVFRWTELVAAGIAALAALVLAIPFVFGRATFEVDIELQPSRVTVGQRALGRLVVRNTGTRRTASTRMEFDVGRGHAELAVPALPPGGQHEELFAVPTVRRAVIPAGPVHSVRGDQLGLLTRVVRWTDVIELFVHPRTVRLHPSAAGVLRDLEGVTSTTVTDHDLAFHTLRPYEPGDDRRYIHWRTSARTGTLMVRQFEETRRSQLTVVCSVDRERSGTGTEFELVCEVFGSIVAQVLREDLDVAAVTEAGVVSTRTVTAMLDATSRFEPVDRTHASLRDFVREATRRLGAPTVVVVIGGAGLEASELRRVQTLYGPEVRVAGFRCAPGDRPTRTRSGSLVVSTIGALADLPRLLHEHGVG
ncbi:DUF58 domain-containing protein [Pseudoclavibacter chungangensis]|uniref:DUF58 domain-containing protein n=1 Tax=Pseudoclavibacter chungangensis TaxID=587635 RepID=A0A7J5BZC3_9MICO|nr:DUF58 domain-containing protein [Pseudoclavibacter chungangensis]KAB1659647.1 DUF58 domain-containing protein [Pseudoclavibacter chungangensis]NYJ67482.1 uncharacterized protein (DUF58 family) [Pseudoclavibacter chungangensis]